MNWIDPTGHTCQDTEVTDTDGECGVTNHGESGGPDNNADSSFSIPLTLACAGCPPILIDHNLTGDKLVQALQALGYVVKTLKDIGLAIDADDFDIAAKATKRGLWILTRDFGDFQKLGFHNVIKVGHKLSHAEIVPRMKKVMEMANNGSLAFTRPVVLAARVFTPFVPPPHSSFIWVAPSFMFESEWYEKHKLPFNPYAPYGGRML